MRVFADREYMGKYGADGIEEAGTGMARLKSMGVLMKIGMDNSTAGRQFGEAVSSLETETDNLVK